MSPVQQSILDIRQVSKYASASKVSQHGQFSYILTTIKAMFGGYNTIYLFTCLIFIQCWYNNIAYMLIKTNPNT